MKISRKGTAECKEFSRRLSERSERYLCAEHVQQLGSESLLSNLMEVKD